MSIKITHGLHELPLGHIHLLLSIPFEASGNLYGKVSYSWFLVAEWMSQSKSSYCSYIYWKIAIVVVGVEGRVDALQCLCFVLPFKV